MCRHNYQEIFLVFLVLWDGKGKWAKTETAIQPGSTEAKNYMGAVSDIGNILRRGVKGRNWKPKWAQLRGDCRGHPGVRWNQKTQENHCELDQGWGQALKPGTKVHQAGHGRRQVSGKPKDWVIKEEDQFWGTRVGSEREVRMNMKRSPGDSR